MIQIRFSVGGQKDGRTDRHGIPIYLPQTSLRGYNKEQGNPNITYQRYCTPNCYTSSVNLNAAVLIATPSINNLFPIHLHTHRVHSHKNLKVNKYIHVINHSLITYIDKRSLYSQNQLKT